MNEKKEITSREAVAQYNARFDAIKDRKILNAIKQFENMRNMAELKALSKVSLERPLSDQEHSRLMDLRDKELSYAEENNILEEGREKDHKI